MTIKYNMSVHLCYIIMIGRVTKIIKSTTNVLLQWISKIAAIYVSMQGHK